MTVIRYAQPPGIRALGVENFPENGLYEAVEQGISLGCPLSPLMGALFLDVLDKREAGLGLNESVVIPDVGLTASRVPLVTKAK